MKFETVAEQDRHYICEIGRLFWGDNKQCYSAYAVFRMVERLMESQAQPRRCSCEHPPDNCNFMDKDNGDCRLKNA